MLKIMWLPIKHWRLDAWEFEGADNYNDKRWTLLTPMFSACWFIKE